MKREKVKGKTMFELFANIAKISSVYEVYPIDKTESGYQTTVVKK